MVSMVPGNALPCSLWEEGASGQFPYAVTPISDLLGLGERLGPHGSNHYPSGNPRVASGKPLVYSTRMSVKAVLPRLPAFVRDRLPQIREACKRYRVERLYLYGSAVTGEHRLGSDLDFMVDFLAEARYQYDGHPRHHIFGKANGSPYPANYRAFTAALEDIFSDTLDPANGRASIDIGTYGCISNSHFKKAVDSQKIEIYA